MINQKLIEVIRTQEAIGYTSQQIYNALANSGYDPNEIKEAMNFVKQKKAASGGVKKVTESYDKKKSSEIFNKRIKLILGIALLVIIIVSALFWFFTRPVCGNEIVEEGETSETCCEDAGCIGEQICENNDCIEPTCGNCQYLENHICKGYICCLDSDCDDNNQNTIDICRNTSTLNATCSYNTKIVLSSSGVDKAISKDNIINFNFNLETYTVSVKEITGSSATMIILPEQNTSNQKTLVQNRGQIKNTDIDGDGIEDISITLVSIDGGRANIRIKKIVYECSVDSDCDDSNPITVDTCINPRTPIASCSNKFPENECNVSTDCDDDDISTEDICGGAPRRCIYAKIAGCTDDDGYCPPNCHTRYDDDCEVQTVDCGTDFDCFINASVKGNIADVTYTKIFVESGINYTSILFNQLPWINESDTYLLYQEVEDISAKYTDGKIEDLLDGGSSQEDIDQLNNETNEAVQVYDGLKINCTFGSPEDLTEVLNDFMDENEQFIDDPKCVQS